MTLPLLKMWQHSRLIARITPIDSTIVYVKLVQLKELPDTVQVRARCGSPIGSHQSTNDPAGRLHNTALRLCAEQPCACSKTSGGITCNVPSLSVEAELTTVHLATTDTQPLQVHDTCTALRLIFPHRVSPLNLQLLSCLVQIVDCTTVSDAL